MTIFIKIIVGVLFAGILYALGSAFYFLMHDRSGSDRTVKALTWRIGLSVLLFVLLFFAFAMGWIHPHAVE